jgi:hypothetical protein
MEPTPKQQREGVYIYKRFDFGMVLNGRKINNAEL